MPISMNDIKWTKAEKKVSRSAFDKAYERERAALIKNLRAKTNDISAPDDLWRLHDFLTERRDEIDEKYDYRYSKLILVFARLVKDGWLDFNDLKGLSLDKIERIKSLVNFWSEQSKLNKNEPAKPNMSLEGDRGFRCGFEAYDIKEARGNVEIGCIKPRHLSLAFAVTRGEQ